METLKRLSIEAAPAASRAAMHRIQKLVSEQGVRHDENP